MKKTKISLSDEQLIEANIPRRFWTFSRDDYFGEEAALTACEQYVTKAKKAYERGLGLILRGLPESGKTCLLTYVLRCLMAKDFSVYYTTLDDLTDWMMRPDSTERFSAKFLEADFVGLDAVNTVNPGTESAFRKFIRLRTDNAMPIIASTAMVPDQRDLFGVEGDPLVTSFKDAALKLVNLSVLVECKVNQFRIERHYRQMKKGF